MFTDRPTPMIAMARSMACCFPMASMSQSIMRPRISGRGPCKRTVPPVGGIGATPLALIARPALFMPPRQRRLLQQAEIIMLYELRLYTVVPGRVEDIHARFRDHLPKLMARHGIDQVARWTATAGPDTPLFVYMMAYDNLAQREQQWDAFYQDDEWWRVRAATNAGEQMVERFDLFLLRPGRAWQAIARDPVQRSGGVHELVLGEVALGHDSEAAEYLRTVYLPAVQREGGDILMVADFVAGSKMPRLAMIIAWPNGGRREAGRRRVDADPAVREAQRAERQSIGRTSIGATTIYVLEPTAFDLPLASLGYR